MEPTSLWRSRLMVDSLEPLSASEHEAVRYFTRRDLMDEEVDPISSLWGLPEPSKLLKRQREDGSWAYPGKNPEKYPDVNYSLVETYKHLRLLVGKYGFDRSHPSIEGMVQSTPAKVIIWAMLPINWARILGSGAMIE